MSDGVYLVDDVGGDGSIDQIRQLLAGIPHGADKAVGSALKRAGKSGMAFASKAISAEYIVKASTFKAYTQKKLHYTSDAGGTSVEIEFKGTHIPLIKFNTSIGKSGRVSTRVKRASAKTKLDHVFGASVGAHTGVFERKSTARFPIEEKLGPSTPQMMSANDDVSQAIGDKVREAFDARIDHEMAAVLNGWRR